MKTKLLCITTLLVSLRLFASSDSKEEFVAHEWGTFTSVQGADGVQLEWNPLIKTDLPGFVYSRAFLPGYGRDIGALALTKSSMSSFVRMETPVIYFYSDQERTADVRVTMPMGRITEWYPRATRVGPYATTNKTEALQAGRSFIEWSGLKILARDTKEVSADKLIREKSGSHYYEARETDANFVRVNSPQSPNGAEYERDLFYRGVGFFQGPLTLNLQDGANLLRLSTRNPAPLNDLFVLTIRNGTARHQYVPRVASGESAEVKLDAKPFAPLSDVRAQLMREMAAVLTKQGLYAKEAEAMVNTWQDQWFTEEGTRVLYLLPPVWTDNTLPLTIEPKPGHVVRVMVGRAELITPAMESELNRHVALYRSGKPAEKQQAVAGVRKLGLGRFLEPATRKMLGKTPSKEFAQAAWSLAQEASKEDSGRKPTVVDKQLVPVAPKTAAQDTPALPKYASH